MSGVIPESGRRCGKKTAFERELLVMAAKAAGIRYDKAASQPHPTSGAFWGLWLIFDGEPAADAQRYWNPLRKDGDALRLAVKLRLVVHVWDDAETVSVAKTLPNGDEPDVSESSQWFAELAYEGERSIEEATRLAILRAAAEIGRAMP